MKKPKPAVPAKMDIAASGQPAETSDLVLKKAKTTVAAKMENPASVEFEDMKRAMRKNTFGQPVDTICGHLKGKKATGEDTGEKPFLYLVKEDEAYVVDNNPSQRRRRLIAISALPRMCAERKSANNRVVNDSWWPRRRLS